MTDSTAVATIVAAFFGALPATIAAVGALVATIRNSKKIDKVAVQTNGITDNLVKAAESAAHQKGVEVGRSESASTAEIAAQLEHKVEATAKALAVKVDIQTDDIKRAITGARDPNSRTRESDK